MRKMIGRMLTRQPWILWISGSLLVPLFAGMAYYSEKYSLHLEMISYVCSLVEEKFYNESAELSKWADDCRSEAQKMGYLEDTRTVLSRLQAQLYRLGISHSAIYTPSEDRLLWEGQGRENGTRVRQIEDKYVVIEVLPGSAALRAGIAPGDIVEEYAGEAVYSEWQLNQFSGTFVLRRGEKRFSVFLEPTEINVDFNPELTTAKKDVGLLKISSFRNSYFKKEDWLKIVKAMARYKAMIIDIRENHGGGFVSALRALSPFFCDRTRIGRLLQPRKNKGLKLEFEDNMDEAYQHRLLDVAGEVGLFTYPGYGCFRGPVTVLTNFQTGSVSEIFAYAFKLRALSRVWGEPTAGDVVLAIWYFLFPLPRGYSISVPEAMYLTHDEINLEAGGVWPDRILSYQLEDALRGRDTWIEQAAVQ